MLNAKSEAKVQEVWERGSAGIIERSEGEKLEAINDERLQQFAWELAAVKGDPKRRNLRCTCGLHCNESQCGHIGAVYEVLGEIQLLPRDFVACHPSVHHRPASRRCSGPRQSPGKGARSRPRQERRHGRMR